MGLPSDRYLRLSYCVLVCVRVTARCFWGACRCLWWEVLDRVQGRPGWGFRETLDGGWRDCVNGFACAWQLRRSAQRRQRLREKMRQRRLARGDSDQG
jgi:hypothetical protein